MAFIIIGSRWRIRNEPIFWQTMGELLENPFDPWVEQSYLRGEGYDCAISNGSHNILEQLGCNRQLYISETGIEPTRFILAVGSIHSRRAEMLQVAGFEVINPQMPGLNDGFKVIT